MAENKASATMETKYIVDELNKLLEKNYNMLSLDGLMRIDMLQLICDVLLKLDVLQNPIVVNNDTVDQAILDILQALNSIKYIPVSSDDPTEFRNGIAMANRFVTHSLLYWLLTNKTQVKKRAYIARYVEKIPIAPEMLQDAQIEQLNANYELLIQDFWKVYEITKSEKKNASMSKELQTDIEKMTSDLQNLSQLIQKQKEKVNNISNKEAFSVSVKTYLSETNNYKKLETQLRDIRQTLNNLENDIKNVRDVLSQKKLRRPTNMDPLVQISEEIHINKILTENQLPEEKSTVESEMKIYEAVAFEAEPHQYDLNSLVKTMDNLNADVKKQVEQKISLSNTDSDKLIPFRNQATIIANKKQEASLKVMENKGNLDKLYATIEDKKQLLYSLVGGEVLHGDELKLFISKLRERSILYKQYRARLQSLTEELSLLGRTYDLLLLLDPGVGNSDQIEKKDGKAEEVQDFNEAKMKLRTLVQKLDVVKNEAAREREDVNNMRASMQNLTETYSEVLKQFEESTGFLTTKIEEMTESKESAQNLIKKKEEKWKQICIDIDKYEQILLKLGEDIINSAEDASDGPTLPKKYEDLLDLEKKREEKLKRELANSDETKNINELQLEIIRKLIVLLSSIWDEKNDQ